MSGPTIKEQPRKAKGLSKFLFGERVFKARSIKGKSQEKIAGMIERSNGYLSNIENGKNYASLDRAVAIANALEVSLDYLAGREDYLQYKVRSMGDIARALMALSFLKGVIVREEKREFDSFKYDKNDTQFKNPIPCKENRTVHVIEIQEGELRHFLRQYQEIFERPHANKFFPQLEQSLTELDQMSLKDEIDTSKWENRVQSFSNGKWKVPKEDVERIIWNRTSSTSE